MGVPTMHPVLPVQVVIQMRRSENHCVHRYGPNVWFAFSRAGLAVGTMSSTRTKPSCGYDFGEFKGVIEYDLVKQHCRKCPGLVQGEKGVESGYTVGVGSGNM